MLCPCHSQLDSGSIAHLLQICITLLQLNFTPTSLHTTAYFMPMYLYSNSISHLSRAKYSLCIIFQPYQKYKIQHFSNQDSTPGYFRPSATTQIGAPYTDLRQCITCASIVNYKRKIFVCFALSK